MNEKETLCCVVIKEVSHMVATKSAYVCMGEEEAFCNCRTFSERTVVLADILNSSIHV